LPKPKYEYKYRKPQKRRIHIGWFLLLALVLGLLSYPFLEAGTLNIQEHTLYAADLPANLKNVKIAYASDIHQCLWFSQERVNEVVRTLNNMSADLIILGGDYATDSKSAIEFFRNMPSLSARLGVFGVLGSSDRANEENGVSTLIAEMKNAGVIPLVNQVESVKVGQSYIRIAGADDYHNGTPDVTGIAAQVSQKDFVIFAGHTPDLMPDVLKGRSIENDSHWFDLALFGSTHGGQVSFLGHTPFANLAPAMGARYLSGWLEENRASILISNGVGTSMAPVRLFTPPQIHLITLKSR